MTYDAKIHVHTIKLLFGKHVATVYQLVRIFNIQRAAESESPEVGLTLPDVPSAKLLQLSGTTYRSIHAPLLHTNDSDLRQRKSFTNWLSQTDHVTVSAPTIHFF